MPLIGDNCKLGRVYFGGPILFETSLKACYVSIVNRKNNNMKLWIIVSNTDIYLCKENLPQGSAEQFGIDDKKAIAIGYYQSFQVMWVNESDHELTDSLSKTSLRSLLHFPVELFELMSKAVQYGHMVQTKRFCSICGGRNFLNHNQLCMQCYDCRQLHYPQIFPSIIVAITKGNKLLLAKHKRHTEALYTMIAGFIEVGETVEAAVKREVYEETRIHIKNIRYVGSQPWAFPSSLMLAYTAEYKEGELEYAKDELSDAAWFDVDNFPQLLAPHGTIARYLIELSKEQLLEYKPLKK